MDPLLLIILLVLGAVVLIVADLFLPSGGMMSVVGVGLLLTACIICFTINRWLGLGVLFAMIVSSPFIGWGLIKAWGKTPIGRRMILDHADQPLPREVVGVGQVGSTLSTLRPMGEAVFVTPMGEMTVQAKSEFGDLPPQTPVRVTHFRDGVATVRPLSTPPPIA